MRNSTRKLARLSVGISFAASVVVLQTGAAAPAFAAPALAAPAMEANQAVPGSPPAGLPSTQDPRNKTKICWKHNGDRIYVINYSSPWGVWGYWRNYWPNDNSFYRQGVCYATNLGRNNWGYCNKDMHEDSLISMRSCDWDDEYANCSPWRETRT
jgi:hypothetical protein